MYLLTLIAVPAVLGLFGKLIFRHKVSWKEYALMEAMAIVFLLLSYSIAKSANLVDEEIWNGVITGRSTVRVGCGHSYTCNCMPTMDSKGNISIDCDTCYKHNNDFSWALSTSTGETIYINRIDEQGVKAPPRWEQAYVGEAVAVKRSYFNYVRKEPGLVLRGIEKVDASRYQIPEYPLGIYDYYRLNRFLSVGYDEPSAPVWNDLLQKANSRLNPKKEVNLIVIAAKTDAQFEYALEEAWLAGKKNDVIVILGVPEPPRISWVGVVSWSVSDEFRSDLSGKIMAIGNLDRRDEVLGAVEQMVNEKFVRRPMAQIKLQLATLEPGKTATIWLSVIAVLLEIGLLVLFIQTDMFADERP